MKPKTMFVCALLIVLALGASSISCAGPVTGFDGARLGDCPDSPNCVCSEMDPGSDAWVEPFEIPARVAPADAFEALAGLLSARASLQGRQPSYLHAVFKTRWLRFRDDLEARLDAEAGVIHVRSASRLGHSDLGANRTRVNNLRRDWSNSLQ